MGGAEGLDGRLVWLAHEPAARDLAQGGSLRPDLERALGGAPGFAWVGEGGDVVAIPHDEDGMVSRDVGLSSGLEIPRGSVVTLEAAEATIRGPGGLEATLVVEGPGSGTLRYATSAEPEAWIRYFYGGSPAAGRPAGEGTAAAASLEGLRFRVFEPGPVELDVSFDPARPYEPGVSRALPRGAQARESTFRTRWGLPISLTSRPPESAYVYAFDPVTESAYTTLDGYWDWAVEGVDPGEDVEFVPGTSGAEFVRARPGFVMRFLAGSPAFAQRFRPETPAPGALPADFPLSSRIPGSTGPLVTTAWTYVQPPPAAGGDEAASYFSEPERAPWLVPDAEDDFLRGLELEAGPLPASPAAPASFPVAPYAGLVVPSTGAGAAWLETVRRFEAEVLATARTESIAALGRAAAPASGGDSEPVEAVTPQGLLGTFMPEEGTWHSVVLAQAEGGHDRLQYTAIQGQLRSALLATELFLVVSDVASLYEHCSTTFRVDEDALALAEAKGVPAKALCKAAELLGQVFQTGPELGSALEAVLEPAYAKYAPIIQRYSELARLTIAGWTLDLASWRWAGGEEPTILVIDLADGDFTSLVGDRSRWTLPDDFNSDGGVNAQRRLKEIIAAAMSPRRDPQLEPFAETVLATGDEAWNGVIYFNAAVPNEAFPPELRALAAGMKDELRAHHVGVTLTPFDVEAKKIELADSSLFGLILYEDEADLVFKGDAYDYKVLSLKVRFANSTIAAFSSEAELLVGRLFGELAQLAEPGARGPNNIVLEGTLQHGAYRFVSTQRSRYLIESKVVDFVTVQRAELVTLPDSTSRKVSSRFVLDGSMGFRPFPEFDLFGFGSSEDASDAGLVFSNLLVTMDFDPEDPSGTRSLAFAAGQMVLDPPGSRPRPASLPARFPLQATAMREGASSSIGEDQEPDKPATPAELGFIPVESPLAAGSLGETWYGLELALSFGTPGGLAAQAGFAGALLASWSPSESGYDVAIGLRLPGSTGGRKALKIMGPLSLSIGRLSFLRDAEASGYLLMLQDIALSFLGLSFPPGGQVGATLFANPDPNAPATTLGWYAAYSKDKGKKELAWPK